MRYIEFGEGKEKVSELIIGLMRIGEMSVKEVTELIQTGLEEGINFLDLADIYAGGKSEELVGKTPSTRCAYGARRDCRSFRYTL